MVYEKEKINETITLMASIPPEDALDFIVEITTN